MPDTYTIQKWTRRVEIAGVWLAGACIAWIIVPSIDAMLREHYRETVTEYRWLDRPNCPAPTLAGFGEKK